MGHSMAHVEVARAGILRRPCRNCSFEASTILAIVLAIVLVAGPSCLSGPTQTRSTWAAIWPKEGLYGYMVHLGCYMQPGHCSTTGDLSSLTLQERSRAGPLQLGLERWLWSVGSMLIHTL